MRSVYLALWMHNIIDWIYIQCQLNMQYLNRHQPLNILNYSLLPVLCTCIVWPVYSRAGFGVWMYNIIDWLNIHPMSTEYAVSQQTPTTEYTELQPVCSKHARRKTDTLCWVIPWQHLVSSSIYNPGLSRHENCLILLWLKNICGFKHNN